MSVADKSWNKAPGAKLDYSVDWSDWLADGETISDSAWTIPSGLTEVSDSESDGVATVWISGGTVATEYTVRNTVTTSVGRIDTRTLYITVVNR